MILIITFKEDYTADFIINRLNKDGIAYRRLNCEEILTSNYQIEFSGGTSYTLLGEQNFDAVWFRRTRLPDLPDMPVAEKNFLLGEIEAFIQNLLCIIEAKWLSEPFYVYRAENKFLQLKEAIRLGFTVPDTLVTGSKTELRAFYEKHNGNIIIKPVAYARINYAEEPQFIFTSAVTPSIMDNLHNHDLTPCIFQENIPKEYELRVTVVGGLIFSAAVYSQEDEKTQTDWRRKKLEFHPVTLPDDVAQKCIRLVRDMNLRFGAIDLIKDTNDNYVFLEINPNGQWAWIETQTGLPIAEAIINELLC
jgi:glutathione synthase/RimK-type ligase-like ATP-grasp enzyme